MQVRKMYALGIVCLLVPATLFGALRPGQIRDLSKQFHALLPTIKAGGPERGAQTIIQSLKSGGAFSSVKDLQAKLNIALAIKKHFPVIAQAINQVASHMTETKNFITQATNQARQLQEGSEARNSIKTALRDLLTTRGQFDGIRQELGQRTVQLGQAKDESEAKKIVAHAQKLGNEAAKRFQQAQDQMNLVRGLLTSAQEAAAQQEPEQREAPSEAGLSISAQQMASAAARARELEEAAEEEELARQEEKHGAAHFAQRRSEATQLATQINQEINQAEENGLIQKEIADNLRARLASAEKEADPNTALANLLEQVKDYLARKQREAQQAPPPLPAAAEAIAGEPSSSTVLSTIPEASEEEERAAAQELRLRQEITQLIERAKQEPGVSERGIATMIEEFTNAQKISDQNKRIVEFGRIVAKIRRTITSKQAPLAAEAVPPIDEPKPAVTPAPSSEPEQEVSVVIPQPEKEGKYAAAAREAEEALRDQRSRIESSIAALALGINSQLSEQDAQEFVTYFKQQVQPARDKVFAELEETRDALNAILTDEDAPKIFEIQNQTAEMQQLQQEIRGLIDEGIRLARTQLDPRDNLIKLTGNFSLLQNMLTQQGKTADQNREELYDLYFTDEPLAVLEQVNDLYEQVQKLIKQLNALVEARPAQLAQQRIQEVQQEIDGLIKRYREEAATPDPEKKEKWLGWIARQREAAGNDLEKLNEVAESLRTAIETAQPVPEELPEQEPLLSAEQAKALLQEPVELPAEPEAMEEPVVTEEEQQSEPSVPAQVSLTERYNRNELVAFQDAFDRAMQIEDPQKNAARQVIDSVNQAAEAARKAGQREHAAALDELGNGMLETHSYETIIKEDLGEEAQSTEVLQQLQALPASETPPPVTEEEQLELVRQLAGQQQEQRGPSSSLSEEQRKAITKAVKQRKGEIVPLVKQVGAATEAQIDVPRTKPATAKLEKQIGSLLDSFTPSAITRMWGDELSNKRGNKKELEKLKRLLEDTKAQIAAAKARRTTKHTKMAKAGKKHRKNKSIMA